MLHFEVELEYIMQKGRKNEKRYLNAWDRSFVKLDIIMPHILIIVVSMQSHCTDTHSQLYLWLGPVKSHEAREVVITSLTSL